MCFPIVFPPTMRSNTNSYELQFTETNCNILLDRFAIENYSSSL